MPMRVQTTFRRATGPGVARYRRRRRIGAPSKDVITAPTEQDGYARAGRNHGSSSMKATIRLTVEGSDALQVRADGSGSGKGAASTPSSVIRSTYTR
jgi:hypothetical protein